jgi:hypothetical protein
MRELGPWKMNLKVGLKSGNKVDKDFIINNMLGNVYDSYCKDILGFVEKILKNEKNENFENLKIISI